MFSTRVGAYGLNGGHQTWSDWNGKIENEKMYGKVWDIEEWTSREDVCCSPCIPSSSSPIASYAHIWNCRPWTAIHVVSSAIDGPSSFCLVWSSWHLHLWSYCPQCASSHHPPLSDSLAVTAHLSVSHIICLSHFYLGNNTGTPQPLHNHVHYPYPSAICLQWTL